jgi:transcriptional regulator with GAF, ATPase, and Fis domain
MGRFNWPTAAIFLDEIGEMLLELQSKLPIHSGRRV